MMARRIDRNLVSLSMFGYLVWQTVVSVVHADGRVFLLDQRNTSDSGGLAEAEHACASHDARLASAEELRHAVMECSFSPCTRGWLDGGSVGTTVCSNLGSALKAVDVKIENTTEDNTHLDVFCVKDKGVPCGDPPAFPNTHLQGHTGFEMGDELLYSCLPGHVLPSGHSAFSLLCDSCGEWYGLVQLCVKDKTEAHIDYEDKFTDDDHQLSYDTPTEEEDTHEEPVEEEVQEETAYVNVEEDTGEEGRRDQEQQEASFSMTEVEEQDVETGGEEEVQGGEELSVGEEEEQEENVGEGLVTGRKEEELEDSTNHPVDEEKQEEEQEEGMGMSEATEAPVSLLSQKHLFWFPSEAFQEAGHVEPTHSPVTQVTPPEGDNRVRASGSESEESKDDNSQPEETKDHDSHEGQFQQPIDHNDHDDHEDDVDHEHIDREYDHDDRTDPDHDESSEQVFDGEDHAVEHLDHDDPDTHDGHEHDNHESNDGEEAHREDQGEHREDDHEKGGAYDNRHDEHYNMGEHEEDDRIQYHSHGEHDDHEDHDHDDVTDHHDDDDHDHSDPSDHHDDHEDQDHVHDHDHLDDHEDQDHDHNDQDDHGHDDHDHDDHEDGHVVPPIGMTTGEPQNVTQEAAGGEPTASTDETWLDGYPVSQEETDTDKVGGGSTEEGVGPEVRAEEEEGLVVVGVTDRPNEVEMSRPVPFTGVPEVPLSPTQEADPVEQDQDQVGGLSPKASPDSPLSPEATSSGSYSADYTTPSLTSSLDGVTPRNAARPSPTDSWETMDHVHPFLEHGPAPTAWTDDVIDEEEGGAEHNLTRHSGEREGEEGEKEGKTGEAGCTGGEEDCPPPPPPSSGRGPTVAAIVIAVCTVALAAAVGAWCYRQKQQKSSMYEMNGKGQSHSRHGQQIEMQQKV
uniref:sushi domain-containing protein 5-like n=1 Tax=Oncorhynchus gorbuscha TaxID=8017 RepID=UPI001EAE87BD|nr:sushi domain-containing protein 5-like [Oncorhynchus gorbuscha]